MLETIWRLNFEPDEVLLLMGFGWGSKITPRISGTWTQSLCTSLLPRFWYKIRNYNFCFTHGEMLIKMAAKSNQNFRILFKNVWNFSSDADNTKSKPKASFGLQPQMPAFLSLCGGAVHVPFNPPPPSLFSKAVICNTDFPQITIKYGLLVGADKHARRTNGFICYGKSYVPMYIGIKPQSTKAERPCLSFSTTQAQN